MGALFFCRINLKETPPILLYFHHDFSNIMPGKSRTLSEKKYQDKPCALCPLPGSIFPIFTKKLIVTHEFIHYFQHQKYGVDNGYFESEALEFTARHYEIHGMLKEAELYRGLINASDSVSSGFNPNPAQYSKQIEYLMNGY